MGMRRVALIGSTLAVALTATVHAAPPSTPDTAALAPRVEALKKKVLADLVFVKGGSFEMGDFGPKHNPEQLPYSGNTNDDVLRKVKLDGYSITAHKITYADFDIHTDATGKPRIAQSELDLAYRDLPGMPAGINWNQASGFCHWLGKQLDLPMDLPSEAQWEYAARNRGEMRVYATDNGRIDDGRNVASNEQFQQYTSEYPYALTMPIGKYPASPLGLYDLIQDAEWTKDWYAAQYNPSDTRNPQGPASGTERVLRGHQGYGGDSLATTSMTFTRQGGDPSPARMLRSDDTTIDSNQNSGTSARCVVNLDKPIQGK